MFSEVKTESGFQTSENHLKQNLSAEMSLYGMNRLNRSGAEK